MSEDGFDANASQNSQSGGIFGTNNNDSKNNAVSSPSKLTKSKLDHIHHDNLSAMSGRDGEDTSSNYSAGGSPMPSALKKKGKTGKDRARKKASFAGDSDDDRDSAASSNMDGDADGDSGKKNDDAASHDSAAYNTKRQELLERERQMNRAAMTKKMSSSTKSSGAAASSGGSGGGSGSSGGDDSGNDGGASGPGRAIPTRYLSARISHWCARCVPDLLASCSPTTMMICLFLIPVFFLIAYTAVPLAEAILSDDYLQAQRGLIVKILDAAGKAQAERRDSSLFLVAPTNTTAERSAIAILSSTRQSVDSALSNVLTTVATSGSGANANQYAGDVLLQAQAIISFYAAERRLVDTRTVTNVQMNSDLLLGVENIYSLVLLIAKDSKASKIQNSFTILVLLGRIQNSFSILRSMGVGVLSNNGVYAENVQQMFAARQAKDRDLLIVQNAGDPSAIVHLNSWQNSTEYKAFYNTVSDLISGDPTKIFNHTVASWVATANTFVGILQVQDEILLAKVASGDSLHATAIAEGMMMMGAVLACLFAGLFVIWYNGKEQEKLEGALMSTRMLARAVQRFVPKNQLRTMGVRSIIEVQPGMSTEVASVLLTAGIRNFSDLAKMMNNTDLFDWIQKYMSRMTHVTQNNSGYIDKVIADTAYAVFSVSKNAVQSAIAMQVVTDQLNAVLVAQGHDHHVTIGIGIHLCPVVTGVYGDGNRLNVAMVSNDVMLASRLEAMTKSFGAKILASDAVVSQIAVANPVIIKKRHHHHNSKQKKEALRKKRELLAKMNRNSDSEGHPATPGGADASADTSQDRSSRTLDSSTGSSGTDSSNGGDDDGQQQSGGSRTGTTGFQLRLVGSVKRIVQAGSTLGSSHISSSESASFSQTVDGADAKKGIFEKTKSERDVGTPHNRNNNNSSDGSSSDLHTASTGGSSSTVALTDIYDIFQADDLVVKQFKVETRRDFEKAIRIVLKDGESKQAKDMLMRLHRKAKNRGIRDVAVDRTIRALRANISENALVICEQAERDVEDMRGGVDDDSPGFGKRNKNNNYSRNRTSNSNNNNNSSKNLTGGGGSNNSIPALKNSFRSTNSNNNSRNAINSTNNNESNDDDEDDEEKYQQELNRRRQQRARREQNEQQQQRRKQNDEEEKQEEEEEEGSSEPSDSRYKPQHVYIPPKNNKNRFSPTNNESSGSPRNPHYIPSSEDENNTNKNHNNSDELMSPNRQKKYQSEKHEQTSSRTAPPSSIDRTAENIETASSAPAASSPTSKQRQLKKSSELTDKNNNNVASTPPSVDALLAQNSKGNDRRIAKKNDTNNSDDQAVDNETTGKQFSIRDNNNNAKNIANGHSGSTNIGILPKGKPVPTAAEHNAREQQKQENGGDVPKQ